MTPPTWKTPVRWIVPESPHALLAIAYLKEKRVCGVSNATLWKEPLQEGDAIWLTLGTPHWPKDPLALCSVLPLVEHVAGHKLFFCADVMEKRGIFSFKKRLQIPIEYRCSAMLLAGYEEIGADIDMHSKVSLVWGYASKHT